MGLFNNFPYMDLSNLNLDFILKKLKDLNNYVDSAAHDAETAENAKTIAEAARDSAEQSAANALSSARDAQLAENSAENYAAHIADPVGGLVTGWLNDNIEPTTPPVDASLTIQGAAADAKATGDAIIDLQGRIAQSSGLTEDIKQAMMDLANAVAFKGNDPTGQTLIDALENSLYPPVNLTYITAVYTQGSTVVYPTTSLDDLKDDLVVTAHYADGTSGVVTNYVLSGILAEGVSTITVTYLGKTTTFTVNVTTLGSPYNLNYPFADISFANGYIDDSGNIVSTEGDALLNEYIPAVGFCLLTSNGDFYQTSTNTSLRLAEYDSNKEFISRTYTAHVSRIYAENNPSYIKAGFSGKDTVIANANRIVALNILDTSTCSIADSSIDNDGNVVTSQGTSVSDYLPIEGGGFLVGRSQDAHDTMVIAFYDASHQLIVRNTIVPSGSGGLYSVFAVPANTAYVRFRCPTTPYNTMYVSYLTHN